MNKGAFHSGNVVKCFMLSSVSVDEVFMHYFQEHGVSFQLVRPQASFYLCTPGENFAGTHGQEY